MLEEYLSIFLNPAKRLYWPFLISSLFFIFICGDKKFVKLFFHASSIVDIKLILLNTFLKVFLFPFFVISSFSMSLFFLKKLRFIFPNIEGLGLPLFWESLIVTGVVFVLDDLLRFLQHIIMHKFRPLFELHKTHHSAVVLTPLTLLRTHPLEAFIGYFRNTVSIAMGIAIYSFISHGEISGLSILGVNAFGFIFNMLFSNLRHSHIAMSFGIFEFIFISPRMHQIHHSNNPAHYNKNFGVALSFWDQVFGSFYRPSTDEASRLEFGLSAQKSEFSSRISLSRALTRQV